MDSDLREYDVAALRTSERDVNRVDGFPRMILLNLSAPESSYGVTTAPLIVA